VTRWASCSSSCSTTMTRRSSPSTSRYRTVTPQKESHDGTVGRDVRSLSSSCWERCAWQVLGETSCARTMSYLDKGMVFIGSSFGDSQVVRLQAERDESGSYVKVSLTLHPRLCEVPTSATGHW
jgi:hypothetical protein